jgi:hypothetical protein
MTALRLLRPLTPHRTPTALELTHDQPQERVYCTLTALRRELEQKQNGRRRFSEERLGPEASDSSAEGQHRGHWGGERDASGGGRVRRPAAGDL